MSELSYIRYRNNKIFNDIRDLPWKQGPWGNSSLSSNVYPLRFFLEIMQEEYN